VPVVRDRELASQAPKLAVLSVLAHGERTFTNATGKDLSTCFATLRPPLSLDRLSRTADGRVVISLRKPLYDGTAAIALTPMQLMKRLAALVPPPKLHTTRYFGAFAAGSRLRAQVIRKPTKLAAAPASVHPTAPLRASMTKLWLRR
jgi:hypothetical protein